MLADERHVLDTESANADQRRHPRHSVFKSAFLYPVLKEANLSIANISAHGLSGRSALSLSLREQVHVSFNETDYHTAEVRWTNGPQCGLIMEEPLLWSSGHGSVVEDRTPTKQRRETRLAVDMLATLVTSAPVMIGTIRNMSVEGMMIEAQGVREGTRLLVKSRGLSVRMGRVQWSSAGTSGIFFERGVS